MQNNYSEIFKIEKNSISPQTGRILISEPFSVGDIFRRSVVLLTDYSKEKGAMGLILNKFIPKEKVDKKFMEELSVSQITISVGGPVGANKLFYVHTLDNNKLDGAIEILPGLYWGGEFEKLKEKLIKGEISFNDVRFFAGYSGWIPNQLENEIKQNSWLVKDITIKEILTINTRIWVNQINQLEKKYKLWAFVPENPQLN
ncbi:MAG: YqgE/AlgH family protein [Bacteroidales bacterium]|nr:YqgE/AlgH family protein [Bacteroidales bacterium]